MGVVIRYAARLVFANNEHSTNNTTKYEALLLALRKMKALEQHTFIIRTDSKVIQEHIEKESEARNPVLMKYLEKVREMENTSKAIQSSISQEMTTMRQISWRKQQPKSRTTPGCVLRNHQRTIHQGFEGQNRECSGDSRLERRNHGLSERPL
jgi:ribonuclease HI